MMMSRNDCWNKNVFSRWRKVAIDGDDWTGKVFQSVAAPTGVWCFFESQCISV